MGGATLYEDMQYESNFKAEETLTEKRQMNFSEEEHIRPPKIPKAEPTKRVKQTPQDGLETCEAEVIDLGMFIPPHHTG